MARCRLTRNASAGLNLSVTADAVPPPLTRGGFGIPQSFASSPEAPLPGELSAKQTERPVHNLPYDRRLNSRAKHLRHEMTPQERKLWFGFLRDYPIKIYKQRVIEFFIVDFYCAEAKLVIELDGSQHYTEQGQLYDHERSCIIEQYGIEVLRFPNREVNRQFEAVCTQIDRTIQQRLNTVE